MPTSLTKAGRYQIVRELGRGAMGVVYEGFDPVIGRTVAIKTMLLEGLSPSEYEEYQKRFQREAQAAGVLSHPNIVTVHDFGEDNGVLYLAMEFLRGMSLQDLLGRGKVLPIEGIIRLYDQVCSALDQAHAHQIVHRDMKPANIMILENGVVKVTDFGIARVLSAGTGMTRVGQVVGTPSYMSPEQVRGLPVDGRSDIFSLGVILYLLLTGQKPFDGPSLTTVIYKIVNEEPAPLSSLDPAIHPNLGAIVAKALAKDPNRRYQTCGALAADLRNYKTLGQPGNGSTTGSETTAPAARAAGSALAPGATKPVELPRAAASQIEARVAQQAASTAEAATPAPRRSSMTLAILAVGTLGLVAAFGGYFLRGYHTSQGAPQNAAPTSAPAAGAPVPSTAAPAPVTPTLAPTSTATQPTSAPQLPTAEATPPPTKAGEAPLKRAPVRTEASSGAGRETRPSSRTSQKAGAASETKPPEAKAETAPAPQPPSSPVVSASATSQVIIETKPPGFDVFIDGKNYGRSDQPVVANITPGQHVLSIRQNGVEVYTKTFTQTTEAHSMTVTPPH
ncbi:MAG TPA: protein kinase [Terriglobia bacterium]|nr:protein kinase [Terriglobia bacterium]